MRSSDPTTRKLFVLDLENLVGGVFTRAAVREMWGVFSPFLTPFDQVVVASSLPLARVALFELPLQRISYHLRTGVNGADLALLDSVDVAFAAGRFATLVIGSSDHLFTQMAESAKAHGMRAWQLTGASRPSSRLHAATSVHAKLHLPIADATPQVLRGAHAATPATVAAFSSAA